MQLPSSAKLESLTFSMPSGVAPFSPVRVTATCIERKRQLTLVRKCEEEHMFLTRGEHDYIDTYSMDPERYSEKDGEYRVIADNAELVGKITIYVGVPPRMTYLNRQGELLPVLSADFHYENRLNANSKNIGHFYKNLIAKECCFDSLEQAMEVIERKAAEHQALLSASV